MEAVVPQTLPICVSPTGKDGVYALFSVLTFYATKVYKLMEPLSPRASSHVWY